MKRALDVLTRPRSLHRGENWTSIGNGEFELQNASDGDARIWHDVDGEFVPKTDNESTSKKDTSAIRKLVMRFDQLKQKASRRLSKTS
jgi:hypothetical protein